MAKYTVEFKKSVRDEGGLATTYVKRTVDDPQELVDRAVRGEGMLDFLSVRKVVEKKPSPAPKKVLVEAPK